jgi:hypothetical protein
MAPHETAGLIGKARPRTSSVVGSQDKPPRLLTRWSAAGARFRYAFGEERVGLLALLTLMVPSGLRSGGVVMAKFSGHDVKFRSSPTVLADSPMPSSTSTCIRSGQPSRSVCSEAIFFTLYRMRSLVPRAGWPGTPRAQQADRPKTVPPSLDAIVTHSPSACAGAAREIRAKVTPGHHPDARAWSAGRDPTELFRAESRSTSAEMMRWN